ncbi:MAG: PAS domain S-box protein [Desulfobacter sp.]|nr:MAG: PAS domain S-box protein [Desulfobacter sp.]
MLESSPVVRFHIRNALGILIILLGLISGTLGAMALNFKKQGVHEQADLERDFGQMAASLDRMLAQVTSALDAMKSVAEADLAATRGQTAFAMPPVADLFRQAGGYFHLDALAEEPAPYGNLTGLGTYAVKPRDELREIRAVLRLGPLMASVQKNIKTSAWVYYFSARSFIHLYPWVSSAQWRFTPDSYEKDFYQLALPGANPGKVAYWTPVYTDEVGKGLMSTCGIPLYEGERFMGTVAVDLTVDFLNGIVAGFRPESGKFFLVNSQSQVVAHPILASSSDPAVGSLSGVLPGGLTMGVAELARIPGGKIHDRQGYRILRADLGNAPWQAVYLEKIPPVYARLMDRIGPEPLVLFLVLFVLILVVLVSGHILLARPADQFVEYIYRLSRGRFGRRPGPLPAMWKPWFTAVEEIFIENKTLTDQIRDANEALEERVARRTEELTRSEGQNRRLKDLYKQLSDASFEAIFLSREGICIGQNRTAETMFGYSQEEALGRLGTEWIAPDFRALVGEKMKQGSIVPYEAVALRRDGSTFPCEIQARMTGEGHDRIRVTALRDITVRKQAEEEKLDAQAFAADQSKYALVGQVAGKMAHDFNNILGVIMGNAELALADCKERGTADALGLILGQTMRGKNMTRNLVAFARDQEPKQKLFSLNKKISLAIDLLKKDLSGIRVVKAFGENLPGLIADPGMIEHMLVNLLINAAHALARQREPEIVITTFIRENNLGFTIRDNGCGIPEDCLDKIFDPSFTLKGGRDVLGQYPDSIRGTGYGMANVKKYLDQHRGRIRVESVQNEGACFTVELPLVDVQLTPEEKEQVAAWEVSPGSRILLVEDEAAISRIQSAALALPPCRHLVDIAENGEQALALFSPGAYDLVSLDYVLPGEYNGIDIYHHIRKQDRDIPILFVSGNIEFLESIKHLRSEDRRVDHLSKPCLNNTYIRAVQELLAAR